MDEKDGFHSVVTKFRLQDVLVIVVCCISVFLFQVPHSYELKASWRLNVEESGRMSSAQSHELISQGIIEDLDADGNNELIISSKNGHIQIYTFPSDDEKKDFDSSILPHLNLKAEVPLNSEDKNHYVISMATGCAKRSERKCDKKILTVLTHDFTVHCYDARLKQLWNKELTVKESVDMSKIFHKESFTLLTPPSIQSDEDGLVIIGSVLEDIKHYEWKFDHDHKSDFTTNQTTKQLRREHRGIDPAFRQDLPLEQDNVESRGNFVTYALSAKTGELKWKHHFGESSQQQRQLEKNLFSGHHFKLQLHHQTYHKGEISWTQYSQSLFTSLPHHWNYPADTTIKLALFQKDKHNKQKNTQTEEESFLESLKKSLEKTSFTPKGSQSEIHPNSIVIHSEKGVDVLNLNTGQPLCKLESRRSGMSMGDVNGDGVLDIVETNFKPRLSPTDLPYCYTVVTSGQSTSLFNGSICHPSFFFSWLEDSEETPRVQLTSMSPLLVPDIHSRNGIFYHLMGHTLSTPNQGYDSLFYISNGKITCYGSHGEYHWQAVTTASWPSNKFPVESGQTRDFVPSIKTMSLQSQGLQESFVVMGWSNMAVVSLFDGRILAEHSLPCQPINPILTGDFNNDGWTDLVVQCKQGYFGFTILRYHGYWYTAAFVAVILVIMATFVSLLRYIDIEDMAESQPKGTKDT